jgi:hypothetical protein
MWVACGAKGAPKQIDLTAASRVGDEFKVSCYRNESVVFYMKVDTMAFRL